MFSNWFRWYFARNWQLILMTTLMQLKALSNTIKYSVIAYIRVYSDIHLECSKFVQPFSQLIVKSRRCSWCISMQTGPLQLSIAFKCQYFQPLLTEPSCLIICKFTVKTSPQIRFIWNIMDSQRWITPYIDCQACYVHNDSFAITQHAQNETCHESTIILALNIA